MANQKTWAEIEAEKHKPKPYSPEHKNGFPPGFDPTANSGQYTEQAHRTDKPTIFKSALAIVQYPRHPLPWRKYEILIRLALAIGGVIAALYFGTKH